MIGLSPVTNQQPPSSSRYPFQPSVVSSLSVKIHKKTEGDSGCKDVIHAVKILGKIEALCENVSLSLELLKA